MREAILTALSQSACSAVTDADLTTVTSLSLKTETVSADDVTGLTALTGIDLDLTDGFDAHLAALTTLRNAHITFHLPQTEVPSAITEQISARYNIPDDFLPHQHQDEFGKWIRSTPPSTRFENLRFTILPGWYPGYADYGRNAPEGPAHNHYAGLSNHLVASNWATTNVHSTERPWWDYPKWQSVSSLTVPQMTFQNITNLTIKFEIIVRDGAFPPGSITPTVTSPTAAETA